MDKHAFTITYYIKNALVLLFYRVFSLIPVSRRIREEHLKRNNIAWESYKTRFSKDIYIEHQPALSEFSYGSRYGADYNSCEVVALYNALVAMGNKPDFPTLLERFEHKGITCLGAFGTSPFALIKYMKSIGYNIICYTYKNWMRICSSYNDSIEITDFTKEYVNSKDYNQYNDFINKCNSYIFMSYNNAHTIRDMIHTMCVTKEGKYYRTHNDYEGAKCYPTLKAAVDGYKDGRSRMILIIGIKKI
ncbi:MAG: hypothetical protein IJ661_09310 [Lachnospiraceae bacterium]|nr:hypothetical protein [Lachnospiraceae bacterium]